MERWKTALYIAGALSLVAALVHVSAIAGHFEEWRGYGAFYLLVAVFQGAYGVALLLWPRVFLFVLGISGNLAILVLYATTRTVEGVGILDLSAAVMEVMLVVVLVGLLRSGQQPNIVALGQGAGIARIDEPEQGLSRRDFLRAAGVAGALGVSGGALGLRAAGVVGSLGVAGGALGVDASSADGQEMTHAGEVGGHGGEGEVDLSRFDPSEYLRDFYWGEERREGGRTVREYELTARDVEIEVAPGVMYPAWTYNGQVPGPTLRARQGDRMRVVLKNESAHPHSIHFHGIHPADMDGVFEQVAPGQEFTYEFDAEPFGMHLYHCHTTPLRKHIEKGLYGAFIIDPEEGREEADEMVMVMNGFDTNFDTENEVYTVNGVAFHYQKHPIRINKGELVRVYLANFTEFDLINSMHIHANFFDYYPTGTSLQPAEYTDTKMLTQGERGIMEFRYDYPGIFMFHAHQSEFAELGWLGLFQVEE